MYPKEKRNPSNNVSNSIMQEKRNGANSQLSHAVTSIDWFPNNQFKKHQDKLEKYWNASKQKNNKIPPTINNELISIQKPR